MRVILMRRFSSPRPGLPAPIYGALGFEIILGKGKGFPAVSALNRANLKNQSAKKFPPEKISPGMAFLPAVGKSKRCVFSVLCLAYRVQT